MPYLTKQMIIVTCETKQVIIVACGCILALILTLGGIAFHKYEANKPKVYLKVLGREIVKGQNGSYEVVDLVSPETGLRYTGVVNYDCNCKDPLTGETADGVNCPYPSAGSLVQAYFANEESDNMVFDVWKAQGPREMHSKFILSPDLR